MNLNIPRFSYSGEEDYQFPALKCRTEYFKKFRNARRDSQLELEGLFIYKKTYPNSRKPIFYKGYLSLKEEYKLLNLKFPYDKDVTIPCCIPVDAAPKERIISKTTNIQAVGTVWIEDGIRSKVFIVDKLDFIPLRYTCIGTPVFGNLNDMLPSIYPRVDYEHNPLLFLAGLIGSYRHVEYSPNENVGCGINIGTTNESLLGGSRGVADPNSIFEFIKRVNIGPIDTLSSPLQWSRYLSVKNPNILSRNIPTDKELDWHFITEMQEKKDLEKSKITASDINLSFDPLLIPERISKEKAKDLKQTILFAKSTPQIEYSKNIISSITVKAEKLRRDVMDGYELAPFLFNCRFEPLCDAFIKGNILAEYTLGGRIEIKRSIVDDFYKRSRFAAFEFIEQLTPFVDVSKYAEILDYIEDKRIIDFLRELRLKLSMSEEEIDLYFLNRYKEMKYEKIQQIISHLRYDEKAMITFMDGRYYPV